MRNAHLRATFQLSAHEFFAWLAGKGLIDAAASRGGITHLTT
jgi:hypothetical protein